jgi:putative Mn2+ efflux pump MntP
VAVKVIALVLPLGLDSFAVAAAIGLLRPSPATRMRISLLFTGFETAMPLIGLFLGARLGHAIGSAASGLAIVLLVGVGVYTLTEGLRGRDDADRDRRLAELTHARGARMLLLGLSVSLDELAIGFTLGLLRVPAGVVVALIAVQTLVVTQIGLRFGARLGARWSERAEQLAGVALTVLGLVLAADKVL